MFIIKMLANPDFPDLHLLCPQVVKNSSPSNIIFKWLQYDPIIQTCRNLVNYSFIEETAFNFSLWKNHHECIDLHAFPPNDINIF